MGFSDMNSLGERNIDFALRMAIQDNDIKRVDQALARGADASACARNGQSALSEASYKKKEGQTADALLNLTTLLSSGAEVSAADEDGYQALHYAAYAGWTEAVKVLLMAGASASARSADGATALHCAALRRAGREPTKEAALALIAAGADVNAMTDLGLTPLMLSAASRALGPLEALAESGANMDLRGHDGRSVHDWVYEAWRSAPLARAEADMALEALGPPSEGLYGRSERIKNGSRGAEAERRVSSWISGKLNSSHDGVGRSSLATPGGQEEILINPLDMALLDPRGNFVRGAINSINAGQSRATISKAIEAEPGFTAWMLPFAARADRLDSEAYQDYKKGLNYLFAIPLRGIGRDGAAKSFLALGWLRSFDYKREFSAAEIKKPPTLKALSEASWVAAPSIEIIQDRLQNFPPEMRSFCKELEAFWSVDWLFNPARPERAALDKAISSVNAPGRSMTRL